MGSPRLCYLFDNSGRTTRLVVYHTHRSEHSAFQRFESCCETHDKTQHRFARHAPVSREGFLDLVSKGLIENRFAVIQSSVSFNITPTKRSYRIIIISGSDFFCINSIRQAHLVDLGHLAQVDQGIAHASQSRVDADVGDVGDLLEAHVVVDPHTQHLPLLHRKLFDHLTEVAVDLIDDHPLLHRRIRDRGIVEVVVVLGGRLHHRDAVLLAEMVDDSSLYKPAFRVRMIFTNVSWNISSVNCLSRTSEKT